MWFFNRKTCIVLFLSIKILLFAIIWKHPSEEHPEIGKTTHQLIELRGFKHESHFIESQNGYILQAIRIVNPHLPDRSNLKPVLLHHGYLGSGSHWLISANGTLHPNGTYWEDYIHSKDPDAIGNSLGFVLATSGYDVWLLNSRGNIYSANHTKLSIDSIEFWQFSLDEIIKYDLPAVIDYVKSQTHRETVPYIAHSLGTTIMFGLLATQPRFNEIVKPFIALSPIGYFTKTKTLSQNLEPYKEKILWLIPTSFGFDTFRSWGISKLCVNPLLRDTVCYWFLWRTGSTWEQIHEDRLPVYLDNGLCGSSTRNLVHLMQHNRGLVHYNFGDPELNRKHYGQPVPPFYDFSQITNKHLVEFHVKNDRYLHLDNIELLKNDIKVKFAYEYEIPDESWGHIDLVWGKDVGKHVNSKILEILAKY